jgi:hypothetical protein
MFSVFAITFLCAGHAVTNSSLELNKLCQSFYRHSSIRFAALSSCSRVCQPRTTAICTCTCSPGTTLPVGKQPAPNSLTSLTVLTANCLCCTTSTCYEIQGKKYTEFFGLRRHFGPSRGHIDGKPATLPVEMIGYHFNQ